MRSGPNEPENSTRIEVGQQAPRALSAIALLRWSDWARVVAWTIAAAVAIAIPTRLIANSWFGRMTPIRPQDWVFWVLGSALTGLVLGLRRVDTGRQDGKAVAGGLGTALAVGCPVCNKLVVALIGVSGALRVFAPFQAVLAIASIALLVWALHVRLRALTATACPACV